MEKLEKAEKYILVVTVLIGGIVALLDFLGVLDNIDWLSERIPALTLLLVSLIATSLLVSTSSLRLYFDKLLPNGSIRHFENDRESFEYILRLIQGAKKSVSDVTWESPYRTTVVFDDQDKERYLRVIEDVSQRAKYREIIMFCGSQSRFEKATRLLQKAGKYYELAIYNDLPDHAPPRKGVIIVDDEEVYLGKVSIRHPQLVDYFCKQFDDYWAHASLVKVGDKLDVNLFEKIKQSANVTFVQSEPSDAQK